MPHSAHCTAIPNQNRAAFSVADARIGFHHLDLQCRVQIYMPDRRDKKPTYAKTLTPIRGRRTALGFVQKNVAPSGRHPTTYMKNMRLKSHSSTDHQVSSPPDHFYHALNPRRYHAGTALKNLANEYHVRNPNGRGENGSLRMGFESVPS